MSNIIPSVTGRGPQNSRPFRKESGASRRPGQPSNYDRQPFPAYMQFPTIRSTEKSDFPTNTNGGSRNFASRVQNEKAFPIKHSTHALYSHVVSYSNENNPSARNNLSNPNAAKDFQAHYNFRYTRCALHARFTLRRYMINCIKTIQHCIGKSL